MENEELITKITHTIPREDGSEVRIVAQACFRLGLTRSTDVYVHRRESPEHDWELCSNSPHPDWKTMPLDEYEKTGRSKMLQTVTPGEILKVTNMIGRPMSEMDEFNSPPEARPKSKLRP